MKLTFALLLFTSPLVGQAAWCVAEKTSTEAIQAAIDKCSAQGGGVAYLPPGEYVTGPIWLKSNVELRLEAGATLALSQNRSDWPAGVPALINALSAQNIALTGRGTIDGRAQYEYTDARGRDVEILAEMEIARKAGLELKRYYRTGVQKYIVVLRDSRDIRIEGIRLVNAPLWTVRLQDCNHVWIHGVYIYSDLEKGVNADGIDIVSTSNVSISDSTIITADDAICLKTEEWGPGAAGVKNRTVRPTENVTVSNSILSSSSTPMVIGTETHADIRHVVFSGIVVRDSNRVFGINVQDGATVSDIRVENVTFELRRRHWNWWGSAEVFKLVLKKRTPESPLGRMENISIRGVQGTAQGTSVILGHPERSLKNIRVEGLQVRMLPESTVDKRATHAMVMERIDGLTLRDIDVQWDKDAPEPGWGSALVLRDISNLWMVGFRGSAARVDLPAIEKVRVKDDLR